MKKILLFIFLIIFIVGYSIDLKIIVYETPPIMFAENGKIKGILPEIINYIAKKENWNI